MFNINASRKKRFAQKTHEVRAKLLDSSSQQSAHLDSPTLAFETLPLTYLNSVSGKVYA